MLSHGSSAEVDDKTLACGIACGHRDCEERLVRKFRERLTSYLRRQMADTAQTEDLAYVTLLIMA